MIVILETNISFICEFMNKAIKSLENRIHINVNHNVLLSSFILRWLHLCSNAYQIDFSLNYIRDKLTQLTLLYFWKLHKIVITFLQPMYMYISKVKKKRKRENKRMKIQIYLFIEYFFFHNTYPHTSYSYLWSKWLIESFK